MPKLPLNNVYSLFEIFLQLFGRYKSGLERNNIFFIGYHNVKPRWASKSKNKKIHFNFQKNKIIGNQIIDTITLFLFGFGKI